MNKQLTIDKIDKILNQCDTLIAQLPIDYQRDYANELINRLNIK